MRTSSYRFTAVFMFLLGAACGFSEEISWRHDPAAALAEAKKNNAIVMVDVYTDWCGWCQKLDETTYKNASVITLASNVVPLKINPEQSAANAAFVKPLHVEGYPAIVFLDSTGTVIDRIDGYLGSGSFIVELSRILKKQGVTFVEPEAISWERDSDAAFKKAVSQNRQILLYLGSAYNEWCAELAEETWSDPEVVKLLKNYECVMIRVGEGPNRSDLFEKYAVLSVPTVLVLEPDGALACRMDGYIVPGEVANQIRLAESIKDRTFSLMTEYSAGNFANVPELLSNLNALGRDEDLKTVFDATVSLASIPDEKRAAYCVDIATLLFSAEKYEESLSYLDIVEGIEPVNETTYYAYLIRAIVTFRQGKSGDAVKYLETLSSSTTIPDLWKSRYGKLIGQMREEE